MPDPIVTPDAPALIDVREVAAMLGVSTATIWRANAAELIPAPVHLLRLTRWRRAECKDWIAAGMPPRVKWSWTPTPAGGCR